MFSEIMIMVQQVNVSVINQMVELLSALIFKTVGMNVNLRSYSCLDGNHVIMAIYNMFGFDNKLLFYVSVVHWRIITNKEIYAVVKNHTVKETVRLNRLGWTLWGLNLGGGEIFFIPALGATQPPL
jgi:hypothetical protein